jgi:8-oxo-dGTP pyrophosphatase MutT (NUDIX family)
MRILGEQVLHEQKWTLLKQKSYLDRRGARRSWSYIERRGRRRAVVIVALTEESGSLLVIEQFRIPLERTVMEFPAGLIDEGETPSEAARRELLEETGYRGEVLEVGPEVTTTAGLSTETVHMVFMRVEESPGAQPSLDGSEAIRVLRVGPGEGSDFLQACARSGHIMDAKLYVHLKERMR